MNDDRSAVALPQVVDRTTWQEARDRLFEREKAHTREGDAIAAARRLLHGSKIVAGRSDRLSWWSRSRPGQRLRR
jgi:predicted dithiol-disulfide oxidoreductase (DUF899 family)